MAFTEEQEKNILSAISKMSEFMENQTKPTPPENKNLKDEAEKQDKMKNDAAEQQNQIEKAISFNMSISKFAEDYKNVLPKSVASILETSSKKSFSSQIAKADEIRKAIIDSYIEIEKNLDGLPESVRAKISRYKELTEDAKKDKSAAYWEIVEIGAAMAKEKNRADAVNKANNYGSAADNVFRERFFEQGNKWKKGDK